MIERLRKIIGLNERPYTLTVPREDENEGLLLLGDPGTGKSQIIHQLLDVIASRAPQEAVVCYDPAGEFIAQHFAPGTDIVLNPLDARCPYWNLVAEIAGVEAETNAPERHFLAESFFPDHPHTAPNTQFFLKAARSIFARMLAFNPSPERLAEMLADEAQLDYCVAGTEHAHLIDKGAKAQRAGVLATLSEVGESLKLLPSFEQCQQRAFSFRKWAQQRQGRIFITSTHSTREALRRLHAAWLNILLGKLLGGSAVTSKQRSCWVVIDEVHALKRLPALESTLVEARKYRVKMVLGTQNKAQFEEHYDRGAATMLASSHTKILFRCNEPSSARWVSEMIGEQEKERPRMSTTATVQTNGRDSINYATVSEHSLVVSKEQIMAAPNLHGYWKYGDTVVPFRIEPKNRPKRAPAFVPRPQRPVLQAEVTKREPTGPQILVKENGHERKRVSEIEITSEVSDDLDTTF